MLLEKAFAKFCGSYGNLQSSNLPEFRENLEVPGQAGWALQVLTGNMTMRYAKVGFTIFERKWNQTWWEHRLNYEDGSHKLRWMYHWNGPDHEAEDVWQWLLERSFAKDPSRTISVTWVNHLQADFGDHVQGSFETEQGLGLLQDQVYSLLGLYQEELDDGSPIRLVKLRNPWGRKEWNGDWSDFSADGACSAKWTENPKLKAKLLAEGKGKNNGVFFMSWEDYSKWFTDVEVGLLEGNPSQPDDDPYGRAFVENQPEEAEPAERQHAPHARKLWGPVTHSFGRGWRPHLSGSQIAPCENSRIGVSLLTVFLKPSSKEVVFDVFVTVPAQQRSGCHEEKYAGNFSFLHHGFGQLWGCYLSNSSLHVMTFESSGLFRFAEGSTVFHHVAQGCEGADPADPLCDTVFLLWRSTGMPVSAIRLFFKNL